MALTPEQAAAADATKQKYIDIANRQAANNAFLNAWNPNGKTAQVTQGTGTSMDSSDYLKMYGNYASNYIPTNQQQSLSKQAEGQKLSSVDNANISNYSNSINNLTGGTTGGALLSGSTGGSQGSGTQGSGVQSDGTQQGSGTSAGSTDVADLIKQYSDIDLKAQLSQLMKSRDSQLSTLNNQIQNLDNQYNPQRSQAATNSQVDAKNFAEYLAARGENNASGMSGVNAQADISRGMQLQGTIGNINQQENTDRTNINSKIADVNNSYDNDVASAKANIDAQTTQQLINQANTDRSRQDALDQFAKTYNIQLAGVTGTLNGQDTLQGKLTRAQVNSMDAGTTGQNINNQTLGQKNQADINATNAGIDNTKANTKYTDAQTGQINFDNAMTYAKTMGYLTDSKGNALLDKDGNKIYTVDGKQLNDNEAQQLKDAAWKEVEATGQVSANASKVLGIKEGTSTLEAQAQKFTEAIQNSQLLGHVTDANGNVVLHKDSSGKLVPTYTIEGIKLSDQEANDLKTFALNKATTFGKVDAKSAEILGVDAGTSTIADKQLSDQEKENFINDFGYDPTSGKNSLIKDTNAFNQALSIWKEKGTVTGELARSLGLDGSKTYTTVDAETQMLTNAINRSNTTGKITGEDAKLLGVEDGTSTLQAKEDAENNAWKQLDSFGTIKDAKTAALIGIPANTNTMVAKSQILQDRITAANAAISEANKTYATKNAKAAFDTATQQLKLIQEQVKAAQNENNPAMQKALLNQAKASVDKVYADIEVSKQNASSEATNASANMKNANTNVTKVSNSSQTKGMTTQQKNEATSSLVSTLDGWIAKGQGQAFLDANKQSIIAQLGLSVFNQLQSRVNTDR